KETITITKASEIPHAIRRAFRLATTGKPGPVHLRLPIDVLEEDVKEPDIYAHPDFTKYPGHRPIAELEKIKEALRLIYNSERPVVICGQGVLYSQAWDEVAEIAEFFGMPVGTTMTGKGSIAEIHPLSIGVVGARGGTGFSNKVIEDSDLIFYIGCNTDSAGTDNWRLPPQDSEKKIIHLDISEAEASNNYRTDVILIGDAKATLRTMMEIASKDITKKTRKEVWIRTIFEEYRKYSEYIRDFMESEEEPVHPLRLIRELSAILPKDVVILADPGTSAIYASAFYKVKNAGRSIIFNYALGALGYAIPASVGAICARPNACIVALTGDGSFGFTAGELETIKRIGGNIKIILFNNVSFGWIRAAFRFGYGPRYFATDFSDVDYVKIAEGFGLMAYRICGPNDIGPVLKSAFDEGPALVEVRVKPEDELVPPVPSWAKKARELGLRYVY
ncbi:MAG: thiamine pyrophosphate-binding protein, partial [Candidatus Bathyarchaeia archaeon]